MQSHVILPSLNAYFGIEQLQFLKSIKFEEWDLVLCVLDFYAKGQDSLYEAYWCSYVMVLHVEMEQAENYMEAKRLYQSLNTNREITDGIYTYLKLSICQMLQQFGFSAQLFNNISGVSPGYNYFRVELSNGTLQQG